MRRLIQLSLILITALFLYGCGFQLKGMGDTGSLPPVLQKVYIDTHTASDYPFARTLTVALEANDAKVTQSPDQATAVIDVLSTNTRSQALSITGGLSAGQYAQYYSVTYEVKDSNGKILQKPLTISANDTYSTNASQQLSANNEIQRIIGQLQRIVSENIVTQLQSVKASSSTILPQE